jgi:hypothetical protein
MPHPLGSVHHQLVAITAAQNAVNIPVKYSAIWSLREVGILDPNRGSNTRLFDFATALFAVATVPRVLVIGSS